MSQDSRHPATALESPQDDIAKLLPQFLPEITAIPNHQPATRRTKKLLTLQTDQPAVQNPPLIKA